MIKTEIITINNKEFSKTYSDTGYYIRKVGTNEVYSEAIDPIEVERVYEETDTLIQKENNDENNSIKDALSILLTGSI